MAICRSLVLPRGRAQGLWGAGGAERGREVQGGHRLCLALLLPGVNECQAQQGPPAASNSTPT